MAKPTVGIVIGSKSDLGLIEKCTDQLVYFGISFELKVASAHRTPKKVKAFIKRAEKKCDLIIAAAGMAAHLPGVVASYTTLPVIGVPVESKSLGGFDALYSIAQMPKGVPVACVAINGSQNAAILAAEILALKYPILRKKLIAFKKKLAKG